MTPSTRTLAIPSFALYGEAVSPQQEQLHIEAVESRSRLYQWEIVPHIHHGLYQVLWVRTGSVEVVLDERHQRVSGPAAIVIPPGVVHGFRFAPDTDGLVLTFSAHFLVEGDFHGVGEAFRRLFFGPDVLVFDPTSLESKRLDALLRELMTEFLLPASAESPVIGWLARAVVWRLAQAHPQNSLLGSAKAHRHHALFTRFMLLVEEHFLAHWSIDQYASRLGLSTPRLNRLTRSQSSRSALEIVHDRLTREACRRLTYIAAPAASLATELGFSDPAYFSRFFKKRTGMSPHQWRNQPIASPNAAEQPTSPLRAVRLKATHT
jgi:AraC family transcriptional activator of pobA